MPESTFRRFHALVLAGDRRADDPLLLRSGLPSKALIDFGGRPMVLHVLDTLAESETVAQITMVGPAQAHWQTVPELAARIARGVPRWLPAEASPSTSAYRVLSALPSGQCVVVTTADHPLLSSAVVDEFCVRSEQSGADVVVGLAPYGLVRQEFPGLKKTVLRFKDGEFCGCNLFAFLNDRGRAVADHWRAVESQRKNPRKLATMLGFWSVISYRLGWLSLHGALQGLSKRLGVKLAVVVLRHPEAAVDVDTVADHNALEKHTRAPSTVIGHMSTDPSVGN